MEGKTLDIFRKAFVPFHEDLKEEKKQGGSRITFVEWYHYVMKAHRIFPEGYSKAVDFNTVSGYDDDGNPVSTLIVKVRITDNETGAYQEALGEANAGKTSWGGAMAEAESQAFRRAMANWGMGLEMYLDDDEWDFWTQGDIDDFEAEPVEEEEEDVEVDDRDPDEMDMDDPDDDLPFEDDAPEGKEATERQIEVLAVIGQLLVEYAEEHEDDDLFDFLEAMRTKLAPGHTKSRAGSVIKRFRRKLEELGLEDPTKGDGD